MILVVSSLSGQYKRDLDQFIDTFLSVDLESSYLEFIMKCKKPVKVIFFVDLRVKTMLKVAS